METTWYFEEVQDLKFSYYAETDMLYVDLSDRTGADAKEVTPGVVIDFDADGVPVGIEIEHASEKVDLSRLDAHYLLSPTAAPARAPQSPAGSGQE